MRRAKTFVAIPELLRGRVFAVRVRMKFEIPPEQALPQKPARDFRDAP